MFRGSYTVEEDHKMRMALPEAFFDALHEEEAVSTLIATVDLSVRCVLLYPYAQWLEVESRLKQLSPFNKEHRRALRLLLGYATEVTLDRHARFTLPLTLKLHAGLESRSILVGQLMRMECWHPTAWQEAVASDWSQHADAMSPMPWETVLG